MSLRKSVIFILNFGMPELRNAAHRGTRFGMAIPVIMEATGYGFIPLSQVMQKISVQLILTHPWQYLAHVVKGWWFFWRAPVYWGCYGGVINRSGPDAGIFDSGSAGPAVWRQPDFYLHIDWSIILKTLEKTLVDSAFPLAAGRVHLGDR